MGGRPARPRRAAIRLAKGLAALTGAEAFLWLYLFDHGGHVDKLFQALHAWWWTGYGDHLVVGGFHKFVDLVGHAFTQAFLAGALPVAAAVAFIALPLGAVTRMIARARVRAGQPDPLDAMRGLLARHARATRVVAWAAAAWTAFGRAYGPWDFWRGMDEGLGTPTAPLMDVSYGIVAVFSTLVLAWMLRAAARAFLSPTLHEAEPARAEVTSDEITFDAVAVTRETIAAVVAMAALPFWPLLLIVMKQRASDAVAWSGMFAQALLAFAAAAHFRYKSKVAVGVDGVYVTGSGRTRFFAYRDLDGASLTRGGDLLLGRGKRTVLRLQLHGQDALKRDAVLARIGEAIARVKDGRGAIAAQLVATASPERLANAASGGADYRGAALTREQLWALVEGPEIDESARRMAAEALARTGDDSERARLRVAAEHCAAPQVRVALLELAEAPVAEDRPARTLAT